MKSKISDYEKRKLLRIKLNDKRNSDKDHSASRYSHDAKVLNRAMSLYHIDGKVAQW
jgi:hypothetical protein